MRTLAVIPARGGSKGIPRKNIRLLCGKPLLWYTAQSALAARRLARVILSTDDEEIAAVGRGCGLEVPFLRPFELARDTTPTLPVLQHAVRWLEDRGDRFDAVCLLEPTSPLRRAGVIDGCVDLLGTAGADAVITVVRVPAEHNPHWVYVERDGWLSLSTGEPVPIPRRQDLPQAFHRNGAVYLTRRDVLMDGNSLYCQQLVGYEMDQRDSVNLDNEDDWLRAEKILQERSP